MYDTQRMVAIAKSSPKYDPVNESLGLYMNVMNIFIRYVPPDLSIASTHRFVLTPMHELPCAQDGANHGQLEQAPPLNVHEHDSIPPSRWRDL
jgi:hypothetical protein